MTSAGSGSGPESTRGPMSLCMQVGGQFGRGRVAAGKQQGDRKAPSMELAQDESLSAAQAVSGERQSAVAVPEHHIHAREEEDEVRPTPVDHITEMPLQEVEVLDVAAVVVQRDIKVAGGLPHREVPTAVHREREDGLVALETERVRIPLMHIEVDDQRPSNLLFSLENSNRHPHVVEHAEAFAVIRAGMVGSAREVRAAAVLPGIPRGEQGPGHRQSGPSSQCRRPGKTEPAFFRLAERPFADLVDVGPLMGELKIGPVDFVRLHEIFRRQNPLVEKDSPQRRELPHRKRMSFRERDLIVFVEGRSHSVSARPGSAETSDHRVGEGVGAEVPTEIAGALTFADGGVVGDLDPFRGRLGLRIRVSDADVIQHHDAAHGDRERIGDALSGDVGGGTMHGFEDGVHLAEVRARSDPEPTNETSAQVADHIAIEVLAEKHVELRRILHQTHAGGVDDQFLVLNVLVVGIVHFLGTAYEEAVALLHDVRLVEHRDLLPAATAGVFERELRDSVGRLLGRDLEARDHARGDLVFDPGIQPFGVLSNHHDVHILVSSVHAVDRPDRSHRTVKIERLAQGDVHRRKSAADRRGAGSLECDPDLLNGVHGFLGQELGVTAIKGGDAGVAFDPVDRGAGSLKGRVDDATGGGCDLRADAVSGNEYRSMFQGCVPAVLVEEKVRGRSSVSADLIRWMIGQDTGPDRPPSLAVLGYREGMPESRSQSIDLVVVGGGIAGLWILDAAIRAGLSAVCVEASKLGSGQSVCAQGIIHGGLKYTLKERDLSAASPISEMPALWADLASGDPQLGPDLSEAVMSSPCTWLWRTDSLASRLGMLGAKAALRTKPSTVDRDGRPALIRDAPGAVLRVDEPVFDTRSVLKTMALAHPASLIAVDGPEGIEFASQGGRVSRVILRNGSAEVTLEPRAVVFAAGAGNEALLSRLGLDDSVAQRRPLHMTLLRSPSLPEFHGHCVDGNRTRVTITSGRDADGRVIWQLGGDLAESGVARDSGDQIAFAATEIRSILPALDLSTLRHAAWSTYRVDRAERRTRSGFRPDDAELVSLHEGRLLVAWPTKWALAPRLAAAVIEALPPEIASASTSPVTLSGFQPPEIADFPWENRTWTSHSDVRSAAPA